MNLEKCLNIAESFITAWDRRQISGTLTQTLCKLAGAARKSVIAVFDQIAGKDAAFCKYFADHVIDPTEGRHLDVQRLSPAALDEYLLVIQRHLGGALDESEQEHLKDVRAGQPGNTNQRGSIHEGT